MVPFRVDLRSDTVTSPSPAMRRAMADADVGDAWYGSDPTVNHLQELAAEALGTEAAIYVPTGTMGNQIALRLHVKGSGHLVASSSAAHVATTEVMTSAVLSGIAFRTVDPGPRGWVDAAQATALLEPDSYYEVEEVDLLAVENTAGAAGGRVLPVEEMRAVRKVADDAGVAVHLDGARLFNAAAAAGVDATEWAREADTVMVCVSKGLGAPIGSLRRISCRRRAGSGSSSGARGVRPGSWRRPGSWPSARAHSGSTRTTSAQGASPMASTRSCRARSITRRLKRTWCSSTRKRWVSRCSRRSNGSRPSGWASRTAVAGSAW